MDNFRQHQSKSDKDSCESVDMMNQLKGEIDAQIDQIWIKIQHTNSKVLLMLSSDIEKMEGFQNDGESLMENSKLLPSRPTEYIQSVIAASPQCSQSPAADDNTEAACMEIIADIERLTEKIYKYLFFWTEMLTATINDSILCKLILEAQMMYYVRGNRYQLFQEDYFAPLLLPHNEEFQNQFGVSATEVISGLASLEHALSQGRIEGMNTIGEFFDRFSKGEFTHPSDLSQEDALTLQKSFFETFSPEHYDVARITKWPTSFIAALAYSPGDATWYEQGEYKNWPIVSLPIQTKPFISLEGNYYCFDYYSLMDNFYRTIQKTILNQDSTYEQTWQIKQKEASENNVAQLFSRLLPGCICYISNYYSPEGKKGQLSENDIMVIFHDALLIVEVKAGSFTFAPPITDWEKNVRSYKTLIENADHQCARTRNYLSKTLDETVLLDSHGREKARIDMSKISDIFEISVTIDDINAFASKAERLSFLNLKSGAISISINDLIVYADYFDGPFQFLHFLAQRRSASRSSKLFFNDELDHLGMYIKNNLYAASIEEEHSCDTVIVMNCRDDLDNYYSQSRQHNLNFEKPRQEVLPRLYLDIFASPCLLAMDNPVQFTSYLLDFSSKTRISFSEQVDILLERARFRGRAQILNYDGKNEDALSLRMSCFIEKYHNDSQFGFPDYRDYAQSTMLANNDHDRHMIILSFDAKGVLRRAYFEKLTPEELNDDDQKRLLDLEVIRAKKLIEEYKATHKKIGRNELCPCGSGKKYKRCHGR